MIYLWQQVEGLTKLEAAVNKVRKREHAGNIHAVFCIQFPTGKQHFIPRTRNLITIQLLWSPLNTVTKRTLSEV